MFFVNFLLVGAFLYVVKRSAVHDGGVAWFCIVLYCLVLPGFLWSCLPGLVFACPVSGQSLGSGLMTLSLVSCSHLVLSCLTFSCLAQVCLFVGLLRLRLRLRLRFRVHLGLVFRGISLSIYLPELVRADISSASFCLPLNDYFLGFFYP
jgi:hypothetical protein